MGQNQNRICAAPVYLHHHGTPQTPEALLQHACIAGSQPAWLLHNEKNEPTAFPIKIQHAFHDGDARLQAALSGLGLVQLPDWLIQPYIEQGRLVPVLVDYEPSPEPIYVLWQKRPVSYTHLTLPTTERV